MIFAGGDVSECVCVFVMEVAGKVVTSYWEECGACLYVVCDLP